MPEYRFDYSYRVRGTTTMEFEDDEAARQYGWGGDDLTSHTNDIYDWEIDDQDVEIGRLDDDDDVEEWLV